jgi:hypothetical protein
VLNQLISFGVDKSFFWVLQSFADNIYGSLADENDKPVDPVTGFITGNYLNTISGYDTEIPIQANLHSNGQKAGASSLSTHSRGGTHNALQATNTMASHRWL